MAGSPKIILSALDWGLGHTTRIIPVARELALRNVHIVLAGTRKQLQVWSEDLPGHSQIELPGYGVRYGKRLPASWHVLRQFPRLLSVIKTEHKLISQAVAELGIQAIISDNRYGVYAPKIPCVMVMHQFVPPISGPGRLLQPILWKGHQAFLQPFQEIWVPDHQQQSSLAQSMRFPSIDKPVRYLGWTSRLSGIVPQAPDFLPPDMPAPDLLCLLSGPEPQRSLLEEVILNQLPIPGKTCWVVQGLPGHNRLPRSIPGGVLIPYLDAPALKFWLPKAHTVLSRSGYSTLMDLASLGIRHIVLVPTPGQPEQIQLATMLQRQKRAVMVTAKTLRIASLTTRQSEAFGFRTTAQDSNNVRQVVGQWLRQL